MPSRKSPKLSLLGVFLKTGGIGDVFYSDKASSYATAIAGRYGAVITTTRLRAVHPTDPTLTQLIKVVIMQRSTHQDDRTEDTQEEE